MSINRDVQLLPGMVLLVTIYITKFQLLILIIKYYEFTFLRNLNTAKHKFKNKFLHIELFF
jgi:hypothetical protein